jgi:hypothetical protein
MDRRWLQEAIFWVAAAFPLQGRQETNRHGGLEWVAGRRGLMCKNRILDRQVAGVFL